MPLLSFAFPAFLQGCIKKFEVPPGARPGAAAPQAPRVIWLGQYCAPNETEEMFVRNRCCQKNRVQLTPALTDFKGPTAFICYRQIFVIAIIENQENLFKGFKNSLFYGRISVAAGSVIAGFNCILHAYFIRTCRFCLRLEKR